MKVKSPIPENAPVLNLSTASLSAVLRDHIISNLLHISVTCPGAGSPYIWYLRLFIGTPLSYHIKLRNLQKYWAKIGWKIQGHQDIIVNNRHFWDPLKPFLRTWNTLFSKIPYHQFYLQVSHLTLSCWWVDIQGVPARSQDPLCFCYFAGFYLSKLQIAKVGGVLKK